MKPGSQKTKPLDNLLVPWLALALALLALGGLIAYSLYEEHGRVGTRERERLDTQAKVIDEELISHLNGINRALEGILKELPLLRGKKELQSTCLHLVALSDAMPGINTILVTDAAGQIVASNHERVIGKNALSRDYFQVPLKDQNSSTLYISPPFKNVLGAFVINVTRLIPGPGGRFGGVVSASLDPAYFKKLLGSVCYAPDMWAALAHGDGKLFLRAPEREGLAGLDLAKPGSPFTRHIESGSRSTVLIGNVLADGEERMIAQRTIRPADLPMDKPFVVAVSRDTSALYEKWQQDLATMAVMFSGFAFSLVVSLYLCQSRQRVIQELTSQYETESRQNAERLELATEASGVGVWDYNLENECLTWSETMFVIYGLAPAKFNSSFEDWRDTLLAEDRAGSEAALQTAIKGGAPFNTCFRIRRDDGEVRIIRSVATVHYNETGKPVRVIGINEDITERQQEAEELRQAKEAAVAADAAKSRLLATVGHEFRTPLSLLISSTDILDRYGERLTKERRTEQNEHIRSAARQMSNLIDSVLSFNRLESARPSASPKLLDIGLVCRAIAAEVDTVWGEGYRFEIAISADLGSVILDEILLRRVLENLLTNAFRYTPSGGIISLQVSREGNRLVMIITDSGIGIAEEDQEKIFKAFFRGRNVEGRRGLGLGLSIVSEALLQMKSTITFASRLGEGTTMRVEIPAAVVPT